MTTPRSPEALCEALWALLLREHPVWDSRGVALSAVDARRWCEQQVSVFITTNSVHLGSCTSARGRSPGSWPGWGLITVEQACRCWGVVLGGLHAAGAGQPLLVMAAGALGQARGRHDPSWQGTVAGALCGLQNWLARGAHGGQITPAEVAAISAEVRRVLEEDLGYTSTGEDEDVLLAQPLVRGSNAVGTVIEALTLPVGARGVIRRGPQGLVEVLSRRAAEVGWPLQVGGGLGEELYPDEFAVAETLVAEGAALESALELARGATAVCTSD